MSKSKIRRALVKERRTTVDCLRLDHQACALRRVGQPSESEPKSAIPRFSERADSNWRAATSASLTFIPPPNATFMRSPARPPHFSGNQIPKNATLSLRPRAQPPASACQSPLRIWSKDSSTRS